MNISFRPFWVLEDNNEDFELLTLAVSRTNLNLKLVRFTRGEHLTEPIDCGDVPQAIYLDLRMPGAGGMTVLKKLATNPAYDGIPKLVFSTSASPPEIHQAYLNGAFAFHVKLTETPAMLELLERTLMYWFASVTMDPISNKCNQTRNNTP